MKLPPRTIVNERVVLGRLDPTTIVGFQWTGAEPEGLNDTRLAQVLGAFWEENELVTYSLSTMQHRFDHFDDGFMEDPD
jgi:hypothetical protein